MTAPVFVASGTIQASSATSGTLSLTEYAGAALNDIQFIFARAISENPPDAAPTISPPAGSGWTSLGANSFAGISNIPFVSEAWWRRRTASGAGSGNETIDFTTAGAVAGNRACHALYCGFSGCITSGTPYEGLSLTNSDGLGGSDEASTFTPASIVTSGADRLGVYLTLISDLSGLGGATSTTAPGGWTLSDDQVSVTGFDGRLPILTKTIASATTEAGAGITLSTGASVTWQVFSLALIPPSGGGGGSGTPRFNAQIIG